MPNRQLLKAQAVEFEHKHVVQMGFKELKPGEFTTKPKENAKLREAYWYKIIDITPGEKAELTTENRKRIEAILTVDKRRVLYEKYLAELHKKTYTENYYEDFKDK